MTTFVIDEDQSRSTGPVLEAHGYLVLDVRDHGLRGKDDGIVYEFAQSNRAAILTSDTGFGNILKFPVGSHFGIVIASFPNEVPTRVINERLSECLSDLTDEDITGNLVIIEPNRLRIRRSS